jgi:hypothetical protein
MNLLEKIDLTEKVGMLHMKGYSDSDIAAELDIKRRDVQSYINDWQLLIRREATTGVEIKDKITNVLFEVEEHWRRVTKEAWNVVEQADNQGLLSQKTAALKLIASVNKDKAAAFDKFGGNYDQELIDEMNRTQYHQEILIKLLREIKDKYPEVAEIIARRISQVTQEAEVLEIGEGE